MKSHKTVIGPDTPRERGLVICPYLDAPCLIHGPCHACPVQRAFARVLRRFREAHGDLGRGEGKP
jgi:hypothetical protein